MSFTRRVLTSFLTLVGILSGAPTFAQAPSASVRTEGSQAVTEGQTEATAQFLDNLEAIDRQIASAIAVLASDISFFSIMIAAISAGGVALITVLALFEIWKIRQLKAEVDQRVDKQRDYVVDEVRRLQDMTAASVDSAEKRILDRLEAAHWKNREELLVKVRDYIDMEIKEELQRRIMRIETQYSSSMSLMEHVVEAFLVNECGFCAQKNTVARSSPDLHALRVQLTHLLCGDAFRVLGALGRIRCDHLEHLSNMTTFHLQNLLYQLKAHGRFPGRALRDAADELLRSCEAKTGMRDEDFEPEATRRARKSRPDAA